VASYSSEYRADNVGLILKLNNSSQENKLGVHILNCSQLHFIKEVGIGPFKENNGYQYRGVNITDQPK
jgi:hypothetical protein